VDDMLIVARNKTHVQKLKAQLKKKFDMKDLGEAKKILSMEITRDRDSDNFGCPKRTIFSRCWRDSTWQKQDQSHSFSRSLQIILQAVSTIIRRGGGDVSSIIC